MILIGDSSALIALAVCDALEKLKNSRVYIAPELLKTFVEIAKSG